MKYTLLLIAVVFLIGIAESNAKGKNDDKANGGKEEKKSGKETVKDDKNAGKETGKDAGKKKEPEKEKKEEKEEEENEEEEEEEEDEETDDDGEEEKSKGKGSKSGKKSGSKKSKKKKQKKQESDEDSEETEDDDDEEDEETKALLKKLTKLKDQAASINPGTLTSALKKTPAKKMAKAIPQINRLAKTLQGTPMGPLFQNLASLMSNNDPKMWNLVFKLFPDFTATIINYAGQLGSTAVVTAGRLGKSLVEFGDILGNGAKDALDSLDPVASIIPGGGSILGLGKQAVETAQVVTMDPADKALGALRTSGKDGLKELKRAQERRRGGL